MIKKAITRFIENDIAYLVPLADLHIGDKNCDYKLIEGYIDWIEKHDNALVWINGDVLNLATTTSASSVFEQEYDLNQQIEKAIEMFKPIKDKILGVISGNHERRLESKAGYNPLIPFCHALGIPYCGYSQVFEIQVGGKHKRDKHPKGNYQSYTVFAHHTTGGGGSVGSKINRVDKLRQIVSNADIYLGSHNHQLVVAPMINMQYNRRTQEIEEQRQLLVDCLKME